MSILLDTGVLAGFLNKDDANTDRAQAIIAACMDGEHGGVFTTSDVVDETFTLLLSRGAPLAHARQLSNQLGWEADKPPIAEVLEIDRAHRREAWRLFERHYEEKSLSYTDCTTLLMVRDRGIDKLATFDDDFEGLVETVA